MATRTRGTTATRTSTRSARANSQTGNVPIPATTGTRSTRSAAKTAPTRATATKTSTARQPLVNKDNISEQKRAAAKKVATTKTTAKPTTKPAVVECDREPIKAFLRIRPQLSHEPPTAPPYLEYISDVSVRMVDPSQDNSPQLAPYPRFRPSTTPSTSIYSFSHVFPPATQQTQFFTQTTLPLVKGLLEGENGLLFAYGVTNSGKTYTIQGGSQEGSAGILPRTLDVIFNSIDGLQSNSPYRPVRLQGVELGDTSSPLTRGPSLDNLSEEPVIAEVLAEHLDITSMGETDVDSTVLKVDRNHEYSVWLSYAEVYNEKIYDLLADVEDTPAVGGPGRRRILLTRKALPIRPSPPSDSVSDAGVSTGKYISGLRQVRASTASEARDLLKLGQVHRRVFGTLANSQSSRSHGVVTIKLLKKHRGENDVPSSYLTARLTIVDLAGSERTKHTQTTGDRLKEAGSINKSLMVLGQCMEVMRANQRRVAQSLAGPKYERSDTREVKKTLAVVPFRHSKLTEVLMDYFVGDGRAVMIVNINPYDTGFDENSHVMKFAALAKEIQTLAPVQRAPPSHIKPSGIPQRALKARESTASHRKVIISTNGSGGRKFSETQVEIVEEEEDQEESEDDYEDEPLNPLVEALFDEVESLRLQLLDAEMRAAVVEAETREEVMREMEERILQMEKMFARRLMNEVEQNEMKMDAKIDMLHRSGLFGKTPGKAKRVLEDMEEEEDVERSIAEDNESASEDDGDFDMNVVHRNSMSPLAGKNKGFRSKPRQPSLTKIRTPVPPGPEHSFLPSDESDVETETTENTDASQASADEPETGDDEDDDDDDDDEYRYDGEPATETETRGDSEEETETDDSDEGVDRNGEPSASTSKPSPASSPALNSFKPSVSRSYRRLDEAPSPIFEKDVKAGRATAKASKRLSSLAQDLGKLKLSEKQNDAEEWDKNEMGDSMIIPPKAAKKSGGKKKRVLGNKRVVTEEEIECATMAADQTNGKGVRRLARGSR